MTDTSPVSSQHSALRQYLQQLESEMRTAQLWGALPPSEQALASTMPFMYDTLKIEEWLQWVFLPRLHALVDGGHALPGECSVQPLAEHEWSQRALGQRDAALRVLTQIDALLSGGAAKLEAA